MLQPSKPPLVVTDALVCGTNDVPTLLDEVGGGSSRGRLLPRVKLGDRCASRKKLTPPPLEGGGRGEGSCGTGPLPPTPSLKGRGSLSRRSDLRGFIQPRVGHRPVVNSQ